MIAARSKPRRKFIAGTTGWTADDLDEPDIEVRWEGGHFEIVEGVLTKMPAAAHYDPSFALSSLMELTLTTIRKSDPVARFVVEVDIIVSNLRVPKADALYLSPADREAQKQANARLARGARKKLTYGRILVPPTLVIESLSRGHEDHDRITKRKWYAEMGVPNYWLLNYFERSLECLALAGPGYTVDAAGTGTAELRPTKFHGLVIPLETLWAQ